MKIDLTESQVEILVQILRSEISGEVEEVCTSMDVSSLNYLNGVTISDDADKCARISEEAGALESLLKSFDSERKDKKL
jgi:hypothetical protein